MLNTLFKVYHEIMAENFPEQQSTSDNKRPHKRSPLFWVLVILVFLVVLFTISLILDHLLTHEGTVTSVSQKSITIKPLGGGKSETFTISSHTKEQTASNKSPIAYNAKDIHDGEVVTVATNGPGSKQAAVILLFAQR